MLDASAGGVAEAGDEDERSGADGGEWCDVAEGDEPHTSRTLLLRRDTVRVYE